MRNIAPRQGTETTHNIVYNWLITIEKHSSPTGDGNDFLLNLLPFSEKIEKHSSPTGDGNFYRQRNHTVSFRIIEKHSSPTGDGNCLYSSLSSGLLFLIEKHSSPTGDGNMWDDADASIRQQILRNIAPRQGTETKNFCLTTSAVLLRNIAPRQGTETH